MAKSAAAEVFNKWRGDMMTKGFGSPSSANAIDAEALKQLHDEIIELIGQDVAIGKSRVIWGGNGGVKAENADDLREGWLNQEKAALRTKVDEYFKGQYE